MNFDELLSEIDDQLEVLGLTRPTTKDDIRESWQKKTLVTHPDRGGTHEAMKKVNLAYKFLSEKPDSLLSSESGRAERKEQERAGRQQRETWERVAREAWERAEREERERAERERQEREQQERERAERLRQRRKRAERQRQDRKQAERQRQERERAECERQEQQARERRKRVLVRVAIAAGLCVVAGASYVLNPLL